MSNLWVLGAADPEMSVIEGLLRQAEQDVAYASINGVRVHPGNAYRADVPSDASAHDRLILVECGLREDVNGPEWSQPAVTVIDHHRPGDPGFGRPPAKFLSASSVGQVYARLNDFSVDEYRFYGCWREPYYVVPSGYEMPLTGDYFDPDPDWRVPLPRQVVLASAADHCLGAAYRGECPGVDPDDLMSWRVASRAAYQRRPEADVMADVRSATDALRKAPRLRECEICACPDPCIEHTVRDMRGPVVPELPEAACRLGVGYVAGPLTCPDGRQKTVFSGTPRQVKWFMACWAPSRLTDVYGDPDRGFAGGYEA